MEVTTDANGAFTVSGLVPPYDALVPQAPGSSAPARPGLGPNAYLGLTTAHPRLGGPPTVVTAERSATLNVPVDVTACGTTGCTFAVGSSVEGSSEFTGGGFGGTYDATHPAMQTVSGPVGWSSGASSLIDIYVVAFNSADTAYWYGSALGVAVSDQGTVTTPSITVTSVPLLPPASFTVDMSLLPGWGPPTLFALLRVRWRRIRKMSFAEVKSTAVSAPVPDIPGATLNASINVAFQNAFVIATTMAPLTSTSVIVQAPSSPVITSPTAGASLSVATGQIAWTGGSSTEVFSVVPSITPDGGQPTFEGLVWTANPSINLARLTTLGFPLTGGPTNISVEGAGKATSLDAMVDEQTLVLPDNTEDNYVGQSFTLTP